MNQRNNQQPSPHLSPRQCWICFDGADETSSTELVSPKGSLDRSWEGEEWVRPCECKGSTAWVHQRCLLAWIERVAPAGSLAPPTVCCPQCQASYKVVERLGVPRWMLLILERARARYRDLLLWAAAGGAGVSFYTLSLFYGVAVTAACTGTGELRKILGVLINRPLPLGDALITIKAAIGLPLLPTYILSLRHRGLAWLYPLIPALVYVGPRSLRYSWPLPHSTIATLLPFASFLYGDLIQRAAVPAIRQLLIPTLPESEYQLFSSTVDSPILSMSSSSSFGEGEDGEGDMDSFQRSVVQTTGILLFPFVAAGLGWLLAPRADPFHRTLLGGTLIVTVREIISTTVWYQRTLSKHTRRVLNRRE